MRCPLSHIEALGEPRRLGPIATSVNKINITIAHFSGAFFYVGKTKLCVDVEINWENENKI